MRLLFRIVKVIDAISSLVGNASVWLVFILMLVMVYEVAMRYVFTAPTIWAMELSGYLMLLFVALGGALVLQQDGHINVDILYSRLSKRAQAVMSVITAGLFFIFLYYFFILSAKQAMVAVAFRHTSGTIWNPPIWPISILLAAGVGLVMLQGIAKFIRDLVMAVTGVPLEQQAAAFKG
ncbi:MAG: TRAP transporter small permease subunit [Desulfarculus sp.]|jgi:TRAP-type mannitol/chloroaromatic compound transport system permease small subunit|nr:MAG: TRAP transporter small permease subunit [Desulfarculus sp.]